jgi:hypothetical protein
MLSRYSILDYKMVLSLLEEIYCFSSGKCFKGVVFKLYKRVWCEGQPFCYICVQIPIFLSFNPLYLWFPFKMLLGSKHDWGTPFET